MRGVESGLDGSLVDVLAEVGQEVADLVLAGVDDVSRGSLVDGVGDLLAETFEAVAQLFTEVVGAELGLGIHDRLHKGEACGAAHGRNDRARQHFRLR